MTVHARPAQNYATKRCRIYWLGGERAVVIYTLIGSAKLNYIDPEAYLRRSSRASPTHPINGIEKLLPWNPNSLIREVFT